MRAAAIRRCSPIVKHALLACRNHPASSTTPALASAALGLPVPPSCLTAKSFRPRQCALSAGTASRRDNYTNSTGSRSRSGGVSVAAMAAPSATLAAAAPAADVYHMGPGTLSISRKALHSATRAKLVSRVKASPLPDSKKGIALLQGGSLSHKYSTDGEWLFRQDSYMFYLFGVLEDGWYGAIDLATGHSVLFMPRLPPEYAVWMGPLKSPEQYKAIHAVDEVKYVDELPAWLKSQGGKCINVLQGTSTDSGLEVKGAAFEGINAFEVDTTLLFDILTECRVHKLPEEVEIIRYANKIGSAAHVAVMQAAKPGMMEYQLESVFLHHCYFKGGSRRDMYTPILASGPNPAILHYGHAGAPNDRQIQDGDLILADLGCEYYQYGSDITTSWPANGKFTPFQRSIYLAVLSAQAAVLGAMKPGVVWTDMHWLANRKILEGLLKAGLVKGDVDAMLAADIGALFMPHGLGHFLGLDTHDVGGYTPSTPPRINRPGIKSLRTARVLEPGMVITVEPGCYFNDALLLPALQDPTKSQYLVADAVRAALGSGGVRIEDNVLVTETGAESFTNVPRTPEDVERIMAGGSWP